MRQLRKSEWVARYGMMIGLAFIFSYIEAMIPISLGVPGIKLGLANLVNIVGLYVIGVRGTIAVSLLRIVLVGLTFSNVAAMAFSLAGGAVSLALMILCKKMKLFDQVGISIVGGVGHNIGQLAVAAFVVENVNVFYYLTFLLVAGTIAGALIGILGGIITTRILKYTRNL